MPALGCEGCPEQLIKPHSSTFSIQRQLCIVVENLNLDKPVDQLERSSALAEHMLFAPYPKGAQGEGYTGDAQEVDKAEDKRRWGPNRAETWDLRGEVGDGAQVAHEGQLPKEARDLAHPILPTQDDDQPQPGGALNQLSNERKEAGVGQAPQERRQRGKEGITQASPCDGCCGADDQSRRESRRHHLPQIEPASIYRAAKAIGEGLILHLLSHHSRGEEEGDEGSQEEDAQTNEAVLRPTLSPDGPDPDEGDPQQP